MEVYARAMYTYTYVVRQVTAVFQHEITFAMLLNFSLYILSM